jgi:hypothetical protein
MSWNDVRLRKFHLKRGRKQQATEHKDTVPVDEYVA